MRKTTYTLEMTSPEQLRSKRSDRPGLRLERVTVAFPELSKFLHTVVGYDYRWGGRADWGREEYLAHTTRDELETWVLYASGAPAGYFELELGGDGCARILCFGLLPPFIGQGLGGHLLTFAVERAWDLGAKRIWLRTCTHDHPNALKNYLARGFGITEQEDGPGNPPIRSIWD